MGINNMIVRNVCEFFISNFQARPYYSISLTNYSLDGLIENILKGNISTSQNITIILFYV